MKHFLASTALVSLALSAPGCDRTVDKPADKAPAKAAGKEPAKQPAADANPAPDAKQTDAKPASDTKAAAPGATVPEHEWLVWYSEGDGFVTKWLSETAGTATKTAERKALVHTNGPSLFHVTRADVEAKIKTCACFDGPEDECVETGSVKHPGLAAIDLDSAKRAALVEASSEEVYGEVYGEQLRVVGGVGGKLFVQAEESGYFCGAHQSVGGHTALFDLPNAERQKWPEIAFPRSVKEAAAKFKHSDTDLSMHGLYDECDGEMTLDEFVDGKAMEFASVAVGLKGGKPALRWTFEAPVYYVCSPDYVATGYADSGLLGEASALGLAGPLPPALAKALEDLGTRGVVGWGELKIAPEKRDALLTKFKAVAETPWPPPDAVVTEKEPPKADVALAKAKLGEGRKLTRAKDYPAAIAAFDEAIAADRKFARAFGERCYAKLLHHEYTAAEKDCDTALKIGGEPRFEASVHYNLGLLLQKQGKNADAKKAFRASLDLRPNKEVQKAHDAL
ncbi:MAG: tetratricopeptide repeat protein [Myxococcota bacterium]